MLSKKFIWVAAVILVGACIATAVVFGEIVHVGGTRAADGGTVAGSHAPTETATRDPEIHPVAGTNANVYTAGPFRIEALQTLVQEVDAEGTEYSAPQVLVTNTSVSFSGTAEVQMSFAQNGSVVATNTSGASAVLGPGQSQKLAVQPVDASGNLLSGGYVTFQLTDLWTVSRGVTQHYTLLAK